jgi:hypothetical protein
MRQGLHLLTWKDFVKVKAINSTDHSKKNP